MADPGSGGPRCGGGPEHGAAVTSRVGIIDASYDSMPQILHQVQARYPVLVIHQVEASVPGQYQQLTDGRLDVGTGRAALAPPQVAPLLFRQDPSRGPDPLRSPVRRAGRHLCRRPGHRAAAARRRGPGSGIQPVHRRDVPGRRLHPHPDRLLRRAAGFEDAIIAAFPAAVVRRFVVHLVRNALRPVARRDAAQVAAGLRTIYTAPTPRPPSTPWPPSPRRPGAPGTPAAWVFEDAGTRLHPFLAFSPAVRKLLYTTNSRSR